MHLLVASCNKPNWNRTVATVRRAEARRAGAHPKQAQQQRLSLGHADADDDTMVELSDGEDSCLPAAGIQASCPFSNSS